MNIRISMNIFIIICDFASNNKIHRFHFKIQFINCFHYMSKTTSNKIKITMYKKINIRIKICNIYCLKHLMVNDIKVLKFSISTKKPM